MAKKNKPKKKIKPTAKAKSKPKSSVKAKKKEKPKKEEKTLEQWLWDAACAIRGAQDAPKYKDFILPLVFLKRLCDVFDDEVNRVKEKVKTRQRAIGLIEKQRDLVRFYLPIKPKDVENDPTWNVVKLLQAQENTSLGQQLTDIMRDVAKENKRLDGIINRIDFNATTHGQRDMDDDQLTALINRISEKRLGLKDVEPDIIGRSYEYLIRKFAEGGGQSAGEFYTPKEVGMLMARLLDPEPGMEAYDPNCGSAGLLIKMELALEEKMRLCSKTKYAPLKLYGQEYTSSTWAMANMNMVIHEMEGEIAIGNTMTKPNRFNSKGAGLKKFDLVTANPMWNQDGFSKKVYENDEFDRFGSLIPPSDNADWGWMLHILGSLNSTGKAGIILGIGSSTRAGSEATIRKHFVDNDFVECVILLPFNLFYNTDSEGVIYILNKKKAGNKKEKVLMINASSAFVKGKPKNILLENSIEEIILAYKDFSNKAGFCKVIDNSEIEKNDYVLRPSKYVFERKEMSKASLSTSKKEYEDTAKQIISVSKNIIQTISTIATRKVKPNRKSIYGLISNNCQVEPLGKYVIPFSERAGDAFEQYEVLSCSKVFGVVLQREKFKNVVASKNKSNYKIVGQDMFVYDPMLLWDGSIGRNYYPFTGIVSPAYSVFKIREELINLDYLEFILRSEFMLPYYNSISDGTNKRRKKARFESFEELQIPIVDDGIQEILSMINTQKRLMDFNLKNIEHLKGAILSHSLFGNGPALKAADATREKLVLA